MPSTTAIPAEIRELLRRALQGDLKALAELRGDEFPDYDSISEPWPWTLDKRLMRIVVPGKPLGKQRPRMARGGHVFTPAPTVNWEQHCASIAWDARGDEPMPGPLALRVWAMAKRPKRLLRKKDPDGRMHRIAKPDGDNVLKIVADGLVRGGVIDDDRLIVDWQMASMYVAKGEPPSVEVELWSVALDE